MLPLEIISGDSSLTMLKWILMGKEVQHFYSHGKLLLTGEYLVMYGAESLALPVRWGQSMEVTAGVKGFLEWQATVQDQPWFNALWDIRRKEIVNTSDPQKSVYLEKAILAARNLNPGFLSNDAGYLVKTNLDYPHEWGLGSSSTFISNLAWWAEVDPMELHQLISSGSGFDIACARSDSAIIYQVTGDKFRWQQVEYHPSYAGHLFFIYLGTKQDTSKSVAAFRQNYSYLPEHIRHISVLTHQLLLDGTLADAIRILEAHESYMSDLLNTPVVKSRLFPDFTGVVKSLGAWGGDFAMVASPLPSTEVRKYFENKGYPVLFEFREMIINK